jgi:hypothetical protein
VLFEESSYVRRKVFEITTNIKADSDREIHSVGQGKEGRIPQANKIGGENFRLERV